MIQHVDDDTQRARTYLVRCDVCGATRAETVPFTGLSKVSWDSILGGHRQSEVDSGHRCPDCRIIEVLAISLCF